METFTLQKWKFFSKTLFYLFLRLLLGLKDDNDDLASKTFNCLSIMVKLLGSEVVIGSTIKKENHKFKHFSNNIPKVC